MINIHGYSFSNRNLAIICVYMCVYPELYAVFVTYSAELLALVSHLFPYRPALCSEAVPEVDSVDGWARLLVQSGLLANPVEDLPVQGPVVI